MHLRKFMYCRFAEKMVPKFMNYNVNVFIHLPHIGGMISIATIKGGYTYLLSKITWSNIFLAAADSLCEKAHRTTLIS